MTSVRRFATEVSPWVPSCTAVHAECLPTLRTLAPESVSAVITDPPYGLSDHTPDEIVQAIMAWANGDRERVPDGRGFMGNEWDRFVPPPAVWDECFRALKPGGYVAVFAGSRTADLMGLSIRLAGFEMRDTITWMYGSGFPKSLDISKAIDKAAGAQRAVIGTHYRHGGGTPNSHSMSGPLGTDGELPLTAPATDAAKQWNGWGTALKPASEPIIVARKPIMGTVAANVLVHDTGGMNIDACRVGTNLPTWKDQTRRWPANVVLSHTEWCDEGNCVDGCAVMALDEQSGILKSPATYVRNADGLNNTVYGTKTIGEYAGKESLNYGDSGGASRFFNTFRYQAKAPRSERPVINGVAHPTVKPQALIEWLVTLFTPPEGTVVDPFCGTGTTGTAALKLGFNSIIIERDAKYQPHINQKLDACVARLQESKELTHVE